MELRESHRDNAEISEKFIIDYYAGLWFLVLDDLGSEKISEYSVSSLGLIIDRRSRKNKPTIVTTNFSLEDIEKEFDPRIASRLADSSIWIFNMEDHRKRR